MKNIIKLTLVAVTTIAFTACGGGGGGGSPTGASTGGTSSTSVMQLNQAMAIGPGDAIVNSSEDAVVEIVIQGTNRVATLIAGSASIKKQ